MRKNNRKLYAVKIAKKNKVFIKSMDCVKLKIDKTYEAIDRTDRIPKYTNSAWK